MDGFFGAGCLLDRDWNTEYCIYICAYTILYTIQVKMLIVIPLTARSGFNRSDASRRRRKKNRTFHFYLHIHWATDVSKRQDDVIAGWKVSGLTAECAVIAKKIMMTSHPFIFRQTCSIWAVLLFVSKSRNKSITTLAKINDSGLQLFSHSPHSHDLAYPGYKLFPNLKRWLLTELESSYLAHI